MSTIMVVGLVIGALLLFALMYVLATHVVPLAFRFALYLTTEAAAERLRGRPRLVHRLSLIVSAAAGAGSCALLYLAWECVRRGGVTGTHGLMMLSVGACLMTLASLNLAFIRSLTPVHDQDAPLPERFVLFLRGFDTDGESDDASSFLGMRQFTQEEDLAAFFAPMVPVLAYQDPRAKAPQLGSVRVKLPSDWRPAARRAIDNATVIVVRVGKTEGLKWELAQVVAAGALMKTLFVFPHEESETKRRDDLREFAVATRSRLTLPADEHPRGSRLLFFDDEGDEEVYPLQGTGILGFLRAGRLSSLKRALVPFTQRVGLRPGAYPVTLDDLVRALVMFSVACVALLWVVASMFR